MATFAAVIFRLSLTSPATAHLAGRRGLYRRSGLEYRRRHASRGPRCSFPFVSCFARGSQLRYQPDMTPLVAPPPAETSARMYVRTIGSVLPVIEPAPLASLKLPIDHPNWLFELKHDGFRGMLYVDRDRGWLRSRKGNEMRRFDALSQQIRALLKGQRVILDGEIVVLDSEGRSIFADLMMGRGRI